MRDPDPDLVIEIDATENAASAAKLEFARDAGAVPVWMRWRGGRVQAPAGAHLIDLIEQTRGLA
jgi:Uma2 family endonuclease